MRRLENGAFLTVKGPMKSKFSLRRPAYNLILAASLLPTAAHAQIDDDEIIVEEDEDEDEDESDISDEEPESDVSEEPETKEPKTKDEEPVASEEDNESPESETAQTKDQSAVAPKTADPAEADATSDSSEESTEDSSSSVQSTTTHDDEAQAGQAAQAALMDTPKKEVSLSPLTFSTSTFSRFEYREGYDQLNVSRDRFAEGDMIVFRARLGIRTNPLPIADGSDVFVQFTPQASGTWGTNGTIGEANLGIYEGYLQFRSQRVDVQLGRLMMDYGDALVIGNLDWHQAGRAFDGGRARYKMSKGYLDVFFTQVAQSSSGAGGKFFAGDDVFWGAYLGIGKYLNEALDLDAYFLGFSNFGQEGVTDADTADTYDAESAHMFTAGLRLKQKLGFFDYRLEAGFQFGRTAALPPPGFSGSYVAAKGQQAYQADGELGVTLGRRTRLAVGGLIASGDDPSSERGEGYQDLYPTGHKFLGLMDVIGARTNIASGNLKWSQGFTTALKAQIDAHVFARLEEGGLGSVGGAGFAGTEVDAQLMQALGKYAQVRGLYGLFIPAAGQYASEDLAHYAEVEARVQF